MLHIPENNLAAYVGGFHVCTYSLTPPFERGITKNRCIKNFLRSWRIIPSPTVHWHHLLQSRVKCMGGLQGDSTNTLGLKKM